MVLLANTIYIYMVLIHSGYSTALGALAHPYLALDPHVFVCRQCLLSHECEKTKDVDHMWTAFSRLTLVRLEGALDGASILSLQQT